MMLAILLITAALALMALNIITEREKRALCKKNAEYIEANRELYKSCEKLANENETMRSEIDELMQERSRLRESHWMWKSKYDRKLDEIGALICEIERLQACNFITPNQINDWKRVEDGGRVYYEKDKIRLIVEDDKVVGWYRP